jgi:hypothetical protein
MMRNTRNTKNGENKMKKVVTWTMGNGSKAEVTVTLDTEEILSYDNRLQKNLTKPCCNIRVEATMDGKDMQGIGNMFLVKNHPVVHARIGDLCITKVNYDRVRAAEAEVEASEYVQAWRSHEATAAKIDAEYKASERRINWMSRMCD